ncbi:hypothetical protein N9A28_02235 [Sulfurimonas sp.]|nr:hypothetical protein [Sulfurimonas sp.]
MIFFGHRFIDSEKFYHIHSMDAIENTPANSTIFVEFNEENLELIKFATKNSVSIALHVENITQITYASALHVNYIVLQKELAKTAQNLAENYLFDAKIIVHVDEDSEIEELALLGVDGVIYQNAIIKINS